jgi:hypothetical protein
MAHLRPACDRHTNLQMIPCSLNTTTEQAHGYARAYVCPVPGCGRHHDDRGYFGGGGTGASLENGILGNPPDAAARAAITKALNQRVRPQIQNIPYQQK